MDQLHHWMEEEEVGHMGEWEKSGMMYAGSSEAAAASRFRSRPVTVDPLVLGVVNETSFLLYCAAPLPQSLAPERMRVKRLVKTRMVSKKGSTKSKGNSKPAATAGDGWRTTQGDYPVALCHW
ncbi:hypothetical protein C2845_PM16G01740 [Panicum miliaceum]|uniref:Uncharacterized protein n=1 Tax=Panicum miliaceum TaxID=4540 RepID=A0A3L6PY31_PANMI|nr:hypothetical protein C2845_PM16G01740 [Panicum miliaceum]